MSIWARCMNWTITKRRRNELVKRLQASSTKPSAAAAREILLPNDLAPPRTALKDNRRPCPLRTTLADECDERVRLASGYFKRAIAAGPGERLNTQSTKD